MHDKMAEHTQVGLNYVKDEIRSREMERFSRRMDRFTLGIFWMTLIVTFATLTNLGVFLVTIYGS